MARIDRALQRLGDAGYSATDRVEGDGILCGYVTPPGRELEILYLPPELDAALGFKTVGEFLR